MTNGTMRTTEAIRRMHFAMPAQAWEVRCVKDGNKRVIRQNYTWRQLIQPSTSAFFRAKNFEGYNIYGRPADRRFILVDDLSEESVDHLIADGLHPAAVVRTSCPYGVPNLQAWIVLSDAIPEGRIATEAARLLAIRYDGDRGATAIDQLGRLPGLRNKKEKHRDPNGGAPLVVFAMPPRNRLVVPTGATLLIDELQARVRPSRPSSTVGGCVTLSDELNLTPKAAIEIYRDEKECLASGFGWGGNMLLDRSRIDHAIARKLLHLGFGEDEIIEVILSGSDKAIARGLAYAQRTVRSAYFSFKS